jgi:PHP family Zn ribbon phosphoesterase
VATVEVDPSYGKYHWTGHRDCNISVPPGEAVRLKATCPICGKKMTKGVAERVEELADRAEGVVPPGAQKYIKVLPLSEIISVVMRKDVFAVDVQKMYWGIVSKFASEMEALAYASKEALVEACGEEVAEVIMRSREGKLVIEPGYDGLYGKPIIAAVEPRREEAKPSKRGERFLRKGRNLDDYTS